MRDVSFDVKNVITFNFLFITVKLTEIKFEKSIARHMSENWQLMW